MADLAAARALHVLSVVLWIGGVSMVTLVLIPSVIGGSGTLEQFERMERRFATQSRITTLLAGLSGLYMVWRLDLWWRFSEARFWWMHTMVAIWMIFSTMLFVLEPMLFHKGFRSHASGDPRKTMLLILGLHRALLALSLIAIAGAVIGSHGGL